MLKPSAPQCVPQYSLVVVVRVTTQCPQTCHYCGYSRHVQRDRRMLSGHNLIGFGKALKEYKTLTGREILVCWLGGEPYLWPDLWSTTQLFREEFSLAIGITTAGMTLNDPTDQRHTLDWVDELTVSVDGLEQHHDWARQTPGGWRKLKERVYQLAQTRADLVPLLRANIVLMRGNIDQFAAICHELATWGFDQITFNQLGGLDRPEFYPPNRILPEQWQQFRQEVPSVRQQLAAAGVHLGGSGDYLDRLEATTLGNKIPIEDCQPGEEFWFVDELGRLSPCSYTSTKYFVPIEELRCAADLERIPMRLSAMRKQSACLACTDCHATHKFAKFRQEPVRHRR